MDSENGKFEYVKNELTFDLFFIREKYAKRLSAEQMDMLDEELDKKIMKMLPGYSGNVRPSLVFTDALKRTAETFVKNLHLDT